MSSPPCRPDCIDSSRANPSDWLDGKDTTGTVDGAPSGTVAGNDILQVGQLRWGATGVDFNFGELLPGTLQGLVHADIDRDCVFDPDEPPIAGVKIELLDERGSVVSTTYTGASGEYRFERIVPGQYAVRETQPDGYFQGSQRAGSHGGNASVADLITQIPVGSGQHLTDYDFCEILPGSISGIVFVDPNQNGNWDSGETRLAGVTVQLLDATGSVVATAQTNTVGYYEFKNLRPGEFGVHELQPTEYFHGGQWAGSHGGNDRGGRFHYGHHDRRGREPDRVQLLGDPGQFPGGDRVRGHERRLHGDTGSAAVGRHLGTAQRAGPGAADHTDRPGRAVPVRPVAAWPVHGPRIAAQPATSRVVNAPAVAAASIPCPT